MWWNTQIYRLNKFSKPKAGYKQNFTYTHHNHLSNHLSYWKIKDRKKPLKLARERKPSSKKPQEDWWLTFQQKQWKPKVGCWPILIYPRLRDFPGSRTFSAKIETVPEKPGWLVTLAKRQFCDIFKVVRKKNPCQLVLYSS